MTDPEHVLSRLNALKTMPAKELRQQWRELFDTEPPPFNRRFLESRLAYRIQELTYGGLKPETVRRLEALGEQLDGGKLATRRVRADIRPIAGTRLLTRMARRRACCHRETPHDNGRSGTRNNHGPRPISRAKRGGRKGLQLPAGANATPTIDRTLVKALARAFRWKQMLETGEFATIGELAEREGIAPSYMTRVLRLTLLAPDIVEAIVDGNQSTELTLARLMEPFSAVWTDQPD
jgi:hypothetical protein